MATNTGIETYTINNLATIKTMKLGIGIEFIKKGNPQVAFLLEGKESAYSFWPIMKLSKRDSAKRNHSTWSRWKLR